MRRDFVTSAAILPAAAVSLAIVALLLFGAAAPHAQTPDPADVAGGMRIYRTKGDCQSCHGWAADGRKMDSQMPDGANLRTTRLDRDKLILAIKCGRPGQSMPAFDRLAYSDGRCYGWTQADLKTRVLTLPDPPATLQPREIEMLADFLFAKVVGQGPLDRAKCIEYWGSDVEVCSEFPK
ncbi:MAG: hypothetical protein EXQ53_11065 [Acidobacteria bacterium]|nr:hypothetical protein [Acidobacteriota bacterium]